eukprot:1100409-Pelagomonas_calceolata.AAC.8
MATAARRAVEWEAAERGGVMKNSGWKKGGGAEMGSACAWIDLTLCSWTLISCQVMPNVDCCGQGGKSPCVDDAQLCKNNFAGVHVDVWLQKN